MNKILIPEVNLAELYGLTPTIITLSNQDGESYLFSPTILEQKHLYRVMYKKCNKLQMRLHIRGNIPFFIIQTKPFFKI